MGRLSIVNVSGSLDQLIDLIARESAQCELLAQNIRHERDAIKRMALDEFISTNQARVSILECLSGLKEEFDAFVRDLAVTHDVPETARTLPNILQRMKIPHTQAIVHQYERLAEQVRTVQQDIAVNQVLVNNIQSFLVRALEAHRQPAPESDVYSILGGRNTNGMPATLIRRKG
jgi:hypothetical protein